MSALRFVLSPSSMAMVFLITFCEVYWWTHFKTTIVIIWTVVYGVTLTVQCYVFVKLMDIQDNGKWYILAKYLKVAMMRIT